MAQQMLEKWIAGIFRPYCPLCGLPHGQAFGHHSHSRLDFVPCSSCKQISEWGKYRLGPEPQDPTYHDVHVNQRFKPFMEAAWVRGWPLSFMLKAWRKAAANGPVALRNDKLPPEEFGKRIEAMMGTEEHTVRFDLEF